MKTQLKNISSLNLITGLLLAGIFSRMIPHVPNFTAVGATALFAGAMLRPGWLSMALPLMILWLSDLFLNNGMYKNMFPESYTGWVWMGNIWVYIGFALIVGIGRLSIKKIGFQNIFVGSLLSSVVFFLLSNFGVWYHSLVWPQTGAGLVGCYAFAVPYFWNTLAGDLIFSGLIFGGYAYVSERGTNLVAES